MTFSLIVLDQNIASGQRIFDLTALVVFSFDHRARPHRHAGRELDRPPRRRRGAIPSSGVLRGLLLRGGERPRRARAALLAKDEAQLLGRLQLRLVRAERRARLATSSAHSMLRLKKHSSQEIFFAFGTAGIKARAPPPRACCSRKSQGNSPRTAITPRTRHLFVTMPTCIPQFAAFSASFKGRGGGVPRLPLQVQIDVRLRALHDVAGDRERGGRRRRRRVAHVQRARGGGEHEVVHQAPSRASACARTPANAGSTSSTRSSGHVARGGRARTRCADRRVAHFADARAPPGARTCATSRATPACRARRADARARAGTRRARPPAAPSARSARHRRCASSNARRGTAAPGRAPDRSASAPDRPAPAARRR